ncbi:leucine-rich repeat protein [Plasmodium vinckei brucechwatti]|uniref:Leucine-rich repeat protein n=1 Tax=Plasmodium vinckei brucechwatti TaxID=119398 RepID=A0A6V7T2C0_PLAVN|nr:leucine-rich repeat protein [Plasmodium vinckei brucechwatti]
MDQQQSPPKIKLKENILYSSNPVLNEDEIADFVSSMNTQSTGKNDKNNNREKYNRVKKIELASLNINDWGLSILIPCILRSKNIVSLNLSNNNLTNDGANKLSQCFQYLPFLIELNLSNNSIGPEGGINIIENLFSSTSNCEIGHFSNNKLIKNEITTLASHSTNNVKKNYISNNSNNKIYDLDLSDNFLGPNFLSRLTQILECSAKTDTDISIKYKLKLKNIGIDSLSIFSFFKNCTHVEILDISENKLSSPSFCKDIEILFKNQTNLTELHISDICDNSCKTSRYNNYGNEIFLTLIKYLHDIKNLKILSYTNNNINDESFEQFCFFLKNNINNKIKEINLSNNFISNLDILNEALKNNQTLNIINLSKNNLTDKNIKLFTYNTLSTNLNIYDISFSFNKLTNLSCHYISDALLAQSRLIKKNNKLSYINNKKLSSPILKLPFPTESHQIDEHTNNQSRKETSLSNNENDIKILISNRHKDENIFFSCIGNISFNRATDTTKNYFIQKNRRILIYDKNEAFFNSNHNFSINCFKGLKFLDLSGSSISNEGISFLMTPLNKPYCPLEFLDISSFQRLNDNTYQTLTSLVSKKKYKFINNTSRLFKHLPLIIRGIPPATIQLNDTDDNIDEENTESTWWNYKEGE